MKIEHIAVWTEDIDRLIGFYIKYFDAQVGNRYRNPSKGFESCFLIFSSGARLEVMHTTSEMLTSLSPGTQRMGLTHLAIAVGAEQAVDQMTYLLQSDGFVILDGPRRTGDGYYEAVVLDPDGNRIEITV
jgi:lactoylglutathione lyase